MEQSRSEKSPGSTSCGGGQQGANGKLMSQQCELQKVKVKVQKVKMKVQKEIVQKEKEKEKSMS